MSNPIPNLAEFFRDYDIAFIDKRVPGRPGNFNPQLLVVHHTASPDGSGDAPCLTICREGRSDVPGPLAQMLLGRAGTLFLITDGRANHPGNCDRATIERAIRGEHQGNPNVCDSADDPGVGAAGLAWGIEAENNGVGEPWPSVQIERYIQICEAFCKELHWDPWVKILAHKKITRRKIDPSFDMRWFLDEISVGDDDMPLNNEDKKWISDEIKKVVSEIVIPGFDGVNGRVDSIAYGPSYAGHKFDGLVKMLPLIHRHLAGDQADDKTKLRQLLEKVYNQTK